MSTRFGLQPARQALARQRWSISAAAQEIEVPRTHLACALYGRTVPAPGVRTGLSILLGLPMEELFTADVLALSYDTTRGPKASERRQQAWAVKS